jgi:branched-chain amino acid transport system substrate-binding protein
LISDDRNTREGIIAADRELLEQGVLAIIGHVTSNTSLIAYPQITSSGVLMFSPYTATSELSGRDDLFIRTSVDTRQYAQGMAKLLKMKQAESALFLVDMSNPSFVAEYADLTRQIYAGRTREIRFHPEEGMDWNSILAEIQIFAPDAIVLMTEVGMTGIAAQKLRQNGNMQPLIATTWAQTHDLTRFGGTAVEGLSLVTFIDPDNQRPAFLKFSENMQDRFGKQANARSTRAFEAIKILAEALRKCAQPGVAELKQQLVENQYHTLMGEVEFDAYGDVLRDLYEVKVKDGHFIKAALLK